MKVETVALDDLRAYEGNARSHSEAQIDEIAESIREFGFNDPVGVWKAPDGHLEIVEGHGRAEAARRLGMRTVPVIRLDHLTDEQRRAYALVHNKTTQDTGFDPETILSEMDELDYDWERFGFDALSVAEARTATDDWEPEEWDDEETDDVRYSTVITVRLRGEEQKAAMLRRLGGAALKRLYRVGDEL